MLQTITLAVGPLQSNCYLLFDDETQNAVVIDPGADGPQIEAAIRERGLTPLMVLNTHGHGDHIAANGHIKDAFDVPLMIHGGDAPMLTDPEKNLSIFLGTPITSPAADRELNDGDSLEFGDHAIRVYHTPGHSPGGVSFYIGNLLFPGDALFKQSVGRSDLPGASHEVLIAGIRNQLLVLPDDTIVYPGHGPATTIGDEKLDNPFLNTI
ncbi:MAG: MBL fold metallo-hydrolase [Candidatus Hinthialibacter antarcticus]|nr:MBL fold metallo-hydrolase [Candidatus Hinthialibacter antarcticus]